MTLVAEQATASRRSAPVGTSERIHALDIIRGFALPGMTFVPFHQKMRVDASGVEDLIPWRVWIFVEQKAWGAFALLFGAGFAILLRRLDSGAERRANLRALGTALPGIVLGRITSCSSLLGLVLLAVRRWPDRARSARGAHAARPAVTMLLPHPPIRGSPRRCRARPMAAARSYGVLISARWALFAASFPPGWRELLPDSNLPCHCRPARRRGRV